MTDYFKRGLATDEWLEGEVSDIKARSARKRTRTTARNDLK